MFAMPCRRQPVLPGDTDHHASGERGRSRGGRENIPEEERVVQANQTKGCVMGRSLLTDDQIRTLFLQLAKGQREFIEADAAVVIGWAEDVRLAGELLGAVLQGELAVTVRDGKVMFVTGEGEGKAG